MASERTPLIGSVASADPAHSKIARSPQRGPRTSQPHGAHHMLSAGAVLQIPLAQRIRLAQAMGLARRPEARVLHHLHLRRH